jgi:hypothetical protein
LQLLLVLVAAICFFAPATDAQRGTCGIAVCFAIDGAQRSSTCC